MIRIVTIYVDDPDGSLQDAPIEEMCEDFLRTKGIRCVDESELEDDDE